MPDHRASRRLRRLARLLPPVLLSGLFMLFTAGVSATAAAAHAREFSADGYHESAGAAALSGTIDRPELVTKTAPTTTERDLAPPVSAGTSVDPLDLYPLQSLLRSDYPTYAESAPRSTQQNRGPPVTGQP